MVCHYFKRKKMFHCLMSMRLIFFFFYVFIGYFYFFTPKSSLLKTHYRTKQDNCEVPFLDSTELSGDLSSHILSAPFPPDGLLPLLTFFLCLQPFLFGFYYYQCTSYLEDLRISLCTLTFASHSASQAHNPSLQGHCQPSFVSLNSP